MGWWLYTIKKHHRYWGLTPLPDLDQEWFLRLGYRHFTVKAGPLPYGEALSRWQRQRPLIPRGAAGGTLLPFLPMLAGNLLRERDIERIGVRAGLSPAEVRDGLQAAWLEGKVERLPAFEVEGDGYRCQRCGSRTGVREEWCPACGRRLCPVCLDCSMLGALRGCEPLYRIPPQLDGGMAPAVPGVQPQFTPAQRLAAEQLEAWLKGSLHQDYHDYLLWAVCGAGKTEVVVPAIQEALRRGQRVLYASPRSDVIFEVYARLQKYVDKASLAFHAGGRHEAEGDGSVVLATTHQAMRFWGCFNLAIIDEPDAFPYANNPLLQRVVDRAVTERGKRMYLTATPSRVLEEAVRTGSMGCIFLPVRFNARPLPIPEVLVQPGLGKPSLKVLSDMRAQTIGTCGNLLVFVPTVKTGQELAANLKAWAPELAARVHFYHARSPERHRWREDLKGGGQTVIATSFLERGINPGPVNVAVWDAAHPVYGVPALVQMAGRAGRGPVSQGEKVYFLARQNTPVIRQALENIRLMNQLAQEGAFLEKEGGHGY